MVRFSSTILAALAAADISLAVPLDVHGHDSTTSIEGRGHVFGGKVDFFSRYDCTNPCLTSGSCRGGADAKGDLTVKDQDGDFSSIKVQTLCWDVPAGAHAVALTVSDGHGFNGSSVSCDQGLKNYHSDNYDGVRAVIMLSGDHEASGQKCNTAASETLPDWVRSISYNW